MGGNDSGSVPATVEIVAVNVTEGAVTRSGVWFGFTFAGLPGLGSGDRLMG